MLRKYKRRVNKKEVQEPFRKWRILRGDTVQILRGRDAGQQGVVKRVDRKRNKVEVAGLNLQRKHVKKTEQREGGTFSVEGAIHVSRINLVCPETKCVRASRASSCAVGAHAPCRSLPTAPRLAARSLTAFLLLRVFACSPLSSRLPTRVRMEFLEDGSKVRVAVRSGAIIERPAVLLERQVERRSAGIMDTDASTAVLDTNEGLHPFLKQ